MAGNDEAVACVFAHEGTVFRLMSHQYPEDLATINMNMEIEFNVKDSEFTRRSSRASRRSTTRCGGTTRRPSPSARPARSAR